MKISNAILYSAIILLLGLMAIGADELGCGSGGDGDSEDDPMEVNCNDVAEDFLEACPDYFYDGFDMQGAVDDAKEAYHELCNVYKDAGCLYECMDKHSGDCEAMAECYFDNDCEYHEQGGVCDQQWVNECVSDADDEGNDCYMQCSADAPESASGAGDCTGGNWANVCWAGCWAGQEMSSAMCIQLGHCESAGVWSSGSPNMLHNIDSLLCLANLHMAWGNCISGMGEDCKAITDCSAQVDIGTSRAECCSLAP